MKGNTRMAPLSSSEDMTNETVEFGSRARRPSTSVYGTDGGGHRGAGSQHRPTWNEEAGGPETGSGSQLPFLGGCND
ncbi:uncharacterized protein CLUP02_10633 [Colletotrichum lupini]|uniref:Uncharacterized protein n=1 Tax=Colletotrichum lupini TaxID=145971 RepID=A0A9Q8SX27_9PEZI|nr:uncharacterized protein CLUP02_10633 [Colletotrichum lupini]UQC85137.1 hypothetical protein CLUP02_10633 [Colletotrichum lupini]